jgi:hypothetical protein
MSIPSFPWLPYTLLEADQRVANCAKLSVVQFCKSLAWHQLAVEQATNQACATLACGHILPDPLMASVLDDRDITVTLAVLCPARVYLVSFNNLVFKIHYTRTLSALPK